MRLIDADALLEELKKTYKYFDLKFYIEDAPTIEPSGDSGVFIPDISVEQLRNAPLEGVEELLAEGVMRDVLEPSKSADQNVADVQIDDLVSRQTLIGAIKKCGEEKIYPQALIQTIKALPSADRPTDESCQDCPLYDAEAKNCPRFNKVIPQTRAEMTADRPTLKQTDTMIIADALRYLIKDTERHEIDRTRAEELREQILQYGASMCSSAERQTVIRSKTLMPTKDFKEWAKRIGEVNPNAVVIPCDAEYVSADRPQVNSNSAEEQIAETCDRPKGKWIRKEDNVSWWVECSKCGEKPLLNVYSHTYEKTPYCPYCGADMREE